MLPFAVGLLPVLIAGAAEVQIATFQSDATPALGTPLCFGLVEPGKKVDDRLTARGIIIAASGKPIVLAAVDWVGIGNEGHDRWRQALAEAAGTTIDRVSVHTLHQHDAPGYDETAERLATAAGLSSGLFDVGAARQAIAAAAAAVKAARFQPVTHLGVGRAKVEQVASNRRILGEDGKVKYGRMSSCRIPEAIAAPEGLIDPYVQSLTFWNRSKPLAVLTYYATHPQSHYGKGGISWEFVGMARAAREAALGGVPHIHFNGAGGNVAAGKYNDGAPERRPVLAARLEDGMKRAWDASYRVRLRPSQIAWHTEPVALPVTSRDSAAQLRGVLEDRSRPVPERLTAARHLAFFELRTAGRLINVNLLRIGPASILHMPGELFVEYQLAAQNVKSGEPVMMAAYGDYGPGYIGTAQAYPQGGYETGPVSRTAPEVEAVLLGAIQKLLNLSNAKPLGGSH